jgi:hypothetical protein
MGMPLLFLLFLIPLFLLFLIPLLVLLPQVTKEGQLGSIHSDRLTRGPRIRGLPRNSTRSQGSMQWILHWYLGRWHQGGEKGNQGDRPRSHNMSIREGHQAISNRVGIRGGNQARNHNLGTREGHRASSHRRWDPQQDGGQVEEDGITNVNVTEAFNGENERGIASLDSVYGMEKVVPKC